MAYGGEDWIARTSRSWAAVKGAIEWLELMAARSPDHQPHKRGEGAWTEFRSGPQPRLCMEIPAIVVCVSDLVPGGSNQEA